MNQRDLVLGWMVWRRQEIWGHQYGFGLVIQSASPNPLLEGTWQGLMMSSFRFVNIELSDIRLKSSLNCEKQISRRVIVNMHMIDRNGYLGGGLRHNTGRRLGKESVSCKKSRRLLIVNLTICSLMILIETVGLWIEICWYCSGTAKLSICRQKYRQLST